MIANCPQNRCGLKKNSIKKYSRVKLPSATNKKYKQIRLYSRLANRCHTSNEILINYYAVIDYRDTSKSDLRKKHPLSNCLPGDNLQKDLLYIDRKLSPEPMRSKK